MHFHEKLVDEHGFKRSYELAAAELASRVVLRRARASRRGAPRRQAGAPCPARHDAAAEPAPVEGGGRLEPRLGRRPLVQPDRHHGRCDQRDLLGLLRTPNRAPCASITGMSEAIRATRACSAWRYAERAQPLLEHARGRHGQVDKDTATQLGRCPGTARRRVDPEPTSPRLRGRSERMFGTLQNRLPQVVRLAAITRHGRVQPLHQGGFPTTTQRPLLDPCRVSTAPPITSPSPAPSTTSLCVLEELHRLKRQRGVLQARSTSDPRRPPSPS